MSYRDVSESLRAYRDRVAAELGAAREAEKEASERAARVKVLEKELAETEGLLDKVRGPRTLPLLENVAIAAPCSASWDEMMGDDKVRFCGHCEKNVYNLSALPRDEAEALLSARESKMCVRLYKRADGTVLTSDCPVGVTRRRRRRAVAGVVGGGLMAVGTSMSALAALATMGAPCRPTVATMGSAVPTMGDVATPMQGEPVAPETAPVDDGSHEMGAVALPPVVKPPAAPVPGHVMGRAVMGKPAMPVMGDARSRK